MKFTHLHSFLELLDGDAFGLSDIEFHALKSYFSDAVDDVNIEEEDVHDVVLPLRKKCGSNVRTIEDRESSLFRVKYLPYGDTKLSLLRNE